VLLEACQDFISGVAVGIIKPAVQVGKSDFFQLK
jgi:hypothetical protein